VARKAHHGDAESTEMNVNAFEKKTYVCFSVACVPLW